MKPYEIWINGYYHMSGGIRALHVLKDELLARGMDAWMGYEQRFDVDCIGVYPEIVANNPEEYFNVVRWKLNKADLPDDGLTYAWESGMGEHPLLTVNILEPELWRPRLGVRRSGVAYWVGKGVRDDQFIPDGAEEIGRHNYPTREQLADRLSTLDYLISFDPFTAVNLEAVCVGTPVLVRSQDPKWGRKEVEQHGWTPFGVAWSMEELPEARANVHLAYDHYQSMLPVFAKRVDDFVEQTQARYS